MEPLPGRGRGSLRLSDPSILPGYKADYIHIEAKKAGRGNHKWFTIYKGQYFFPFHVPYQPGYVYRCNVSITGSFLA